MILMVETDRTVREANSAIEGGRRAPIRGRRFLMWALYGSYVAALIFVTFRISLWLFYSVNPVGLSTTVNLYQAVYPELVTRGIIDSKPDGKTCRVLLLGGSVAEQTGDVLEQQLNERIGRPVKVFNAGYSAHTTRDSLHKLRYLTDSGGTFDLIIVYHGINDVNLNRYPADVFQEDYSHAGWYAHFESMRKNGGVTFTGVIGDATRRLTEDDQQAGFDHGADIKTPPAFAANLRSMIEIAAKDQTLCLLMSFASYLPKHYSREAFEKGKLEYSHGAYKSPVEVWGWADNVRNTIAAHNRVIREVAADHPELLFIDMEAEVTQPADFSDVCHLTDAGIDHFVQVVADAIADSDLTVKLRSAADSSVR